MHKISSKGLLLFLIPSLIGIFLFMVPISVNGEISIPVAILAGWLGDVLGDILPQLMTAIITATVIGSYITRFIKPKVIMENSFWRSLFEVNNLWLVIRTLGMIFAIMTLFQVGPEIVWSDYTGGLLLGDLLPILFTVFLFAGLFLPLLLNFGLLEFFGTLLTKIMRPLFTLPGRSSIDSLTSWMGDGTIGVILTNQQYEQGYYTKREAAVIGTTFSVVSITFSIVILGALDLEAYIIPYYLTIVAAGLVAAVIMPRIPPLSRKPDTYYEKAEKKLDESIPAGQGIFKWGLIQATKRAEQHTSAKPIIQGGIKNVLDMWMGVIPIVMAIGTLGVIIAEGTRFFEIIGAPFVPILSLMGVPEAAEAAQLVLIGFADMYLPAILGSGIESEMTRFIIGCLSVTQLIYLSEVGGVLLASKLPVRFLDLVIIFLERTLITLPVIVIIAHIIF